jgi:hypothetical protein
MGEAEEFGCWKKEGLKGPVPDQPISERSTYLCQPLLFKNRGYSGEKSSKMLQSQKEDAEGL